MATPVTRSGLIDELFRLLCHPFLLVLLIMGLIISLLVGAPITHPVIHVLLLLIVSSFVAKSATHASWFQFIGVCGVACILMSVTRDDQAGELKIIPWSSPLDAVESYQRGSQVVMHQHLGDPMTLRINKLEKDQNADQAQVTLQLGTAQTQLDYQRFLKRETVKLGRWNFQLKSKESAQDRVRLKLKFTHRVSGESSSLLLERDQIDHVTQGPQRKIVVQVAQVRQQKNETGTLYTQVMLNAQWIDEATGKPVEPQRILLRSDLPDYDRSFGTSPFAISIESVQELEQFVMTVREQMTYQLAWVGFYLVIIGLFGRLKELREKMSASRSNV